MVILIHTSKTMRRPQPAANQLPLRQPALSRQAAKLAAYVRGLSLPDLQKVMALSPALAAKTHATLDAWNQQPAEQTVAVDSFIGDIYSGLRAGTLSEDDRQYADQRLRILSGLYGVLRPLDGIMPYRLEMGYRLPDPTYANLYKYWGTAIADTLPADGAIINLAAAEYSKTVTPYVDEARVITPKFLTIHPQTKQPVFVVVHAKIARGAFARWLITEHIGDTARLTEFADIGYRYDPGLSSDREPVFVCREFGGKGLSMRLQA